MQQTTIDYKLARRILEFSKININICGYGALNGSVRSTMYSVGGMVKGCVYPCLGQVWLGVLLARR